jgi:hypothetical protein
MKVKCVRLLDHEGNEVTSSPWLTLGKTYHVLSIFVDAAGKRRFSIDSQPPGEWPSNAEHQFECFEVVSTVVPSNWRVWVHQSSSVGISPAAWQVPGFAEALIEHDPATYSVFDRERRVILSEDP